MFSRIISLGKNKTNQNKFFFNEIFLTFLSFNRFFAALWGYHKQGSCQAGMSAAITKVNIILSISLV